MCIDKNIFIFIKYFYNSRICEKTPYLNSIVDAVRAESEYPLSFEALGQGPGLVVYETKLPPRPQTSPALLAVPGARDRAYVFLDHRPAGVLARCACAVSAAAAK